SLATTSSRRSKSAAPTATDKELAQLTETLNEVVTVCKTECISVQRAFFPVAH
ncbi:unnamed protein product, partial [Amoebophrya sp. A120]